MNYIVIVTDNPQRREHLARVAREAFREVDIRLRILNAEPLMNFKGCLADGIMEHPKISTSIILDADHLWNEDWFAVIEELRAGGYNQPIVVVTYNCGRERILNNDDQIQVLYKPYQDEFQHALRTSLL